MDMCAGRKVKCDRRCRHFTRTFDGKQLVGRNDIMTKNRTRCVAHNGCDFAGPFPIAPSGNKIVRRISGKSGASRVCRRVPSSAAQT